MTRNRRTLLGACGALVLALCMPRAAAGPLPCPWDLDGNTLVSINDLLGLLSLWGTNPGGPPDFDGDLTVGVTDLLEFLANWGPCPGFGPCGTVGSGSCYVADATPACEGYDCCNAVCAVNPACCDTAWDAACATLAAQTCGNCGDPGAGDCCVADTTQGCDDAACCEAVCAIDGYCCDVQWDEFCAQRAVDTCGICPP
jgi:hypothetical protein